MEDVRLSLKLGGPLHPPICDNTSLVVGYRRALAETLDCCSEITSFGSSYELDLVVGTGKESLLVDFLYASHTGIGFLLAVLFLWRP